MTTSRATCPICNSQHLAKVNSYKHHCYACNDCNNVFHVQKQGKYLLEWFLPRSIFKRLLPPKAFLRLFRDKGDISAADFYDVYAEECRNLSGVRQSEVDLLLDQFRLIGVDLAGKSVLDISGGPGLVAKKLQGTTSRFVVTEFSEKATRAMTDVLGVETAKFDYTTDSLQDVFAEKFDVVLIRSSIIFCPDLDAFVASLNAILSDGGHVLVETIMPTLGEVFWWQQMEYKFPNIYSQETLEKFFYKHGFSFAAGYRDYGSYTDVRGRETRGFMQKSFTWLVDYPMVLSYYASARKSRVPIDQRLHKKMLTQLWTKTGAAQRTPAQPYRNFEVGTENLSSHFGQQYNGYLRK